MPTPPTTTVNAGPDLVTTKTVDKATANPVNAVTDIITVTNQSTATAAAATSTSRTRCRRRPWRT